MHQRIRVRSRLSQNRVACVTLSSSSPFLPTLGKSCKWCSCGCQVRQNKFVFEATWPSLVMATWYSSNDLADGQRGWGGLHVGAEGGANCEHLQVMTNLLQTHWAGARKEAELHGAHRCKATYLASFSRRDDLRLVVTTMLPTVKMWWNRCACTTTRSTSGACPDKMAETMIWTQM